MQAADQAVLFVSSRLLRRILRADLDPAGTSLHAVSRRHHVISRDHLLDIVDRNELPPDLEQRPETLILLDPNAAVEAGIVDLDDALRFFWRELFRAHIVMALIGPDGEPRLSEVEVRQRRHRLGEVEFNEARLVLRQEHVIFNDDDDRVVYIGLATHWLDLRHFEPDLISVTFPAVRDSEAVDRLLGEDVDAGKLLDLTRPAPNITRENPSLPPAPARPRVGPREVSPADAEKLLREADAALAVGNVVRSALYRAAAGRMEESEADLKRLAERLEAALPGGEESGQWFDALLPLLRPASLQYWSVEARLLYELQKVCIEHEQKLYSTDAVEWLLWYGQRKLKRHLPLAQTVSQIRSLRKARKLLDDANVTQEERNRLDELSHPALETAEQVLHATVLPLLGTALDDVGLRPENPPERLARTKLTQELADRLLAWGFLTFGDVRDALARNQLKLPDLASPLELVRGDPLLRLDRRLAVLLDGVYRRAEIYLRYLQTLSLASFGTRVGRALTRYLALPFGGAFVILTFIEHTLHEWFGKWFDLHHVVLTSWMWIVGVGLAFFVLLHVPTSRVVLLALLQLLGRALRWTFVTLPGWLVPPETIRWLLMTPPVLLFRRYLIEATLAGLLTALVAMLLQSEVTGVAGSALLVFGGTALFCNSPPGRRLRDVMSDAWAFVKHLLWVDIVLGVLRAAVEIFSLIIAWAERLLYTIDELTRFREGQGPRALRRKVILGVGWFYVRYTLRFIFLLFLEPQVNPLKHFPTVTVAHKLLLPTIPLLAEVLIGPLDPALAGLVAFLIIGSIPGVFGFIVWESKENWRLYRANRPRELEPVIVGEHGEQVIHLMRPGFHSGTLPRLFAKLRAATRQRDAGELHRLREQREHVGKEMRSFVERECVALLESSQSWGKLLLEVGDARLSLKRIEVELKCPTLGDESLVLVFEEHAGRLGASVRQPEWLRQISLRRVSRFRTALAGLYKLAGVALAQDDVALALAKKPAVYLVQSDGVLAWPPERAEETARYPWPMSGSGRVRAQAARGEWPPVPAGALDFRKVPLTWQEWVDSWRRDEKKQADLPLPRTGPRLLHVPGEDET